METLRYNSEGLTIIDQLLLPRILKYVRIDGCKDAWSAIRDMQVRGAAAIAIVGGLGLAVELKKEKFDSRENLSEFIKKKFTYLCSARPTAINIVNLSAQINAFLKVQTITTLSPEYLKLRIISELEKYLIEDISINKSIGFHGLKALSNLFSDKMVILTHCNAGALATSGYGTALGVVRKLYENNVLERCYFTETRPYNQGSRLTAYELHHEGIPSTLICDSMVAALMANKKISAVVTGADCVAANGDTANKVGTYQIAVLAKYHNVPFFVASALSSVNLNIESGESITIEERPSEEITELAGVKLSVDGVNCWNPSFDVTPQHLITGIITEIGVFDGKSLKENVRKHLDNA